MGDKSVGRGVSGGLVALILAACGDGGQKPPDNPELNFPKTFLWGAAMAGFQSEMGCPTLAAEVCEDRASDWYQWVSDPDLIADDTAYVTGEPIGHSPGFRELYPADLARIKDELHGNAVRVSIEWSRLFPDGAAETAEDVDALAAHAVPSEVAYYRALFTEARRLGLDLVVTLNHYTLPLWLHDGKACHDDLEGCEDRGWLDRPRMVRALRLYAGYCGRTFGDLVDTWATLNEPLATVLAGYILPSADRSHPPGVMLALEEAIAVLFNQIYGHAAMVDGVRAEDVVDADKDGRATYVGTVVNLTAFEAADPEAEGAADAVRHASWLYNELFVEGVANGQLDLNIDGVLDAPLPELTNRLDWLGVNYYTRLPVAPVGTSLLDGYPWLDFLPETDGGLFLTYPEGMYEVLVLAQRFGVPIIVTENGMNNPTADGGESFLKPHLRAMGRAMAEGVNVEGYFYWTLVDNYEWNHGMALPFGLYALDLESKVRTRRPIADAFANIGKDRGF